MAEWSGIQNPFEYQTEFSPVFRPTGHLNTGQVKDFYSDVCFSDPHCTPKKILSDLLSKQGSVCLVPLCWTYFSGGRVCVCWAVQLERGPLTTVPSFFYKLYCLTDFTLTLLSNLVSISPQNTEIFSSITTSPVFGCPLFGSPLYYLHNEPVLLHILEPFQLCSSLSELRNVSQSILQICKLAAILFCPCRMPPPWWCSQSCKPSSAPTCRRRRRCSLVLWWPHRPFWPPLFLCHWKNRSVLPQAGSKQIQPQLCT